MRLQSRTLQVFILIICLVLAGSVLAKKKAAEKQFTPKRSDHLPTMEFVRGTLKQSISGTWEIDGTSLYTNAATVWTVEGNPEQTAYPRAGREVIVMGYYLGSAFNVCRGQVLLQDYQLPEGDRESDIEWSTEDQEVGEGQGPT